MQRFEFTKLGKAGRSAIGYLNFLFDRPAIGYPNFLFDRPAIGYPNFLFARLISNWHFWDNALRIFYTVLQKVDFLMKKYI